MLYCDAIDVIEVGLRWLNPIELTDFFELDDALILPEVDEDDFRLVDFDFLRVSCVFGFEVGMRVALPVLCLSARRLASIDLTRDFLTDEFLSELLVILKRVTRRAMKSQAKRTQSS